MIDAAKARKISEDYLVNTKTYDEAAFIIGAAVAREAERGKRQVVIDFHLFPKKYIDSPEHQQGLLKFIRHKGYQADTFVDRDGSSFIIKW